MDGWRWAVMRRQPKKLWLVRQAPPPDEAVARDGELERKWPVRLRLLFMLAASLALWALIVLIVMLVAG